MSSAEATPARRVASVVFSPSVAEKFRNPVGPDCFAGLASSDVRSARPERQTTFREPAAGLPQCGRVREVVTRGGLARDKPRCAREWVSIGPRADRSVGLPRHRHLNRSHAAAAVSAGDPALRGWRRLVSPPVDVLEGSVLHGRRGAVDAPCKLHRVADVAGCVGRAGLDGVSALCVRTCVQRVRELPGLRTLRVGARTLVQVTVADAVDLDLDLLDSAAVLCVDSVIGGHVQLRTGVERVRGRA
jgi:hypothetical protein